MCFVCKCFSCTISSWNFFHICDSSNHILVFIHVKKTFRALQCQMCGTYFKKKWRITTYKKSMNIFMVSSRRYQYFRHLLPTLKVPKSTMGFNNHNKWHNFLMAGPLEEKYMAILSLCFQSIPSYVIKRRLSHNFWLWLCGPCGK